MLTTQKHKVSLKGLYKTLRQRWIRGTYTEFDIFLARISGVSLEDAQKIREDWEDVYIIVILKSVLVMRLKNR